MVERDQHKFAEPEALKIRFGTSSAITRSPDFVTLLRYKRMRGRLFGHHLL